MVLYWGVILVIVVAAARWLARAADGAGRGADKTPRQILDERYARGEIDKDEFERRKKDLES
jgi:putative membrane protein